MHHAPVQNNAERSLPRHSYVLCVFCMNALSPGPCVSVLVASGYCGMRTRPKDPCCRLSCARGGGAEEKNTRSKHDCASFSRFLP